MFQGPNQEDNADRRRDRESCCGRSCYHLEVLIQLEKIACSLHVHLQILLLFDLTLLLERFVKARLKFTPTDILCFSLICTCKKY
jgi:hypothetical protein